MDSIYPSTCNGSLFFTLQYRDFFMSIVRRFQIEDFASSGDCALEFCALINFFLLHRRLFLFFWRIVWAFITLSLDFDSALTRYSDDLNLIQISQLK
jgi:hypothetical protein